MHNFLYNGTVFFWGSLDRRSKISYPWYTDILTFENNAARRGICQIFFTSKIPIFFNSTQEKLINRDIFGQQLRIEDFYSSILNKLSVFLQLSTQIQIHSIFLWKLLPKLGKLYRYGNFLRQCLKILPEPKNVLQKCNLWLLWQIPRLNASFYHHNYHQTHVR